MRIRYVVSPAVVAALTLASAALVLEDRGPDAAPPPAPTFVAEHPVAVPEEPRTVSVSRTMPMPSAHERKSRRCSRPARCPPGP